MARIHDFLRAESGATAIEYSMIAGLISIGIVAIVTTIGQNLQSVFYNKLLNAF